MRFGLRALVLSSLLLSIVASVELVFARESVSPEYLWQPTNSFPLARLIFCGEPGQRLAIYRDMSHRYFTTKDETSLVYDIPVEIRANDEMKGRQRLTLVVQDEQGHDRVYGVLKVSPEAPPLWLQADEQGREVRRVPCKAFRFSAEFIKRSW